MSIKLRWLGWACFEIVLPSGKVLLTDPFIDYSNTAPIKSSELSGADYIALTHTHFDHCTDIGSVVNRFHSKVICSSSIAGPLAEFFDIRWSNLIRVRAGDVIKFDDLQIEVIRAEHIYMPIQKADELSAVYPPPMNKMMPALIHAGLHQMPVRDMEMINFLFQTSDNLRVLMFGGVTSENQKHEIAKTHPNVALFQTGSPEVVADFAAVSGAAVVIPYHHDSNPAKTHENAQALASQLALKSKAAFLDIRHGQWYEIGVKVNS
jgi:L-ascorbate metabolism protein UlaG (beta-lactamase superfamily)